jgi:hypothetical protein
MSHRGFMGQPVMTEAEDRQTRGRYTSKRPRRSNIL